MKKHLRICAFVLSLVFVLCAASGCVKQNGDKDKDDGNAVETFKISEDYVIVRPQDDDLTVNLAKDLKKDIESVTKMSLAISDDWVEDESQIPAKEIIVGKADRKESKKVYKNLDKNEWSVLASGEKIIIAGNSNKALSDAVNYFTETYVKGKSVIEMEINASHSAESKLVRFAWKDGELVRTGINGGYPRLYALKDGTMLLGYDGMYVARSTDNGLTWKDPVKASLDYPGTANAALFQDDDGVIYLGFRSTGNNADGSFFANIHVTCSRDNGKTWEKHSTVYENTEPTGVYKGVWEPHFGMMNGKLTCFYANDSTSIIKNYQNIEYKQWDEEKKEWNNRTVVFDGLAHKSRDGMPVWQQLSTGEYVCVVEAFNKDDNDKFAVKLSWSEDGVNWSEPVTVMRAKKKGTPCAAPYIVELPNGQIVISCQTSEKSIVPGLLVMSTVISDGTPVKYLTEDNFADHDYPDFDVNPTVETKWNGMYVYNGYLFACTICSDGGTRIVRYKFDDQLK